MTIAPRALIFGVTGQDGAYLARFLLTKGYEVFGTSRDADVARTAGLVSVAGEGRVTLISASPVDFRSVFSSISRCTPDEIYNLAGQSSVGLSFSQPVETMGSIAVGMLNILETVRLLNPRIKVYNAGSSECFGDTGEEPADESTAFRRRSPYGVAKAAAFWQVANYREAYRLFCSSGILFNRESPLRPQRFVTRKIVRTAVAISKGSPERLRLGPLDITRDWGWAPEYVEAMRTMLQAETPDDFVIASGCSHSLEAFVAAVFQEFGLDWRAHVDRDEAFVHPTDIAISRGDPSKPNRQLDWHARVTFPEIIRRLVAAELSAAQSAPC